MASQNSED
jgi:hypothetical protein